MQDAPYLPHRFDSPDIRLLPPTFVGFLGFLAIGIPLPILALFVHDRLGFTQSVCGVVIGTQSIATLMSRRLASRLCDQRGTKSTSLFGLVIASVAGLCCRLPVNLLQT